MQQMPLAHACETHCAPAAHVAPFGCGVGVKVGVIVGGGVTVGVAVGVGVGTSWHSPGEPGRLHASPALQLAIPVSVTQHVSLTQNRPV